jgi:hypothetical protein
MEYLAFFAEEPTAFELVVGYIGNAFALFFFFSPCVLMYNLITGKTELKNIPYILLFATWLNATLWFIYGFYLDKFTMQLCNIIGCGLSVIYIGIYIWFFFENYLFKIGAVIVTWGVLFGVFAAFFWGFGDKLKEVTSTTAVVFNIIMYAAPGQNIVKFILTYSIKSSKQKIII